MANNNSKYYDERGHVKVQLLARKRKSSIVLADKKALISYRETILKDKHLLPEEVDILLNTKIEKGKSTIVNTGIHTYKVKWYVKDGYQLETFIFLIKVK